MEDFPTPDIPEIGRGASLAEALRPTEENRIHIRGATGGALAATAVTLAKQRGAPQLLVTPDVGSARKLAVDLDFHGKRAHSKTRVLLYSRDDQGPYDDLVPDRRSTMSRAGILLSLTMGDFDFLVVPAQSLADKIVSKERFENACFPIAVGDSVDRDTVVETLERGGYNRTPLVEEPGTYAVRGGLLDFFPSYSNAPVRVELFGSEVDSIRLFSSENQSSRENLQEVWIHPVRLFLIPTENRERNRAAEVVRKICDDVDLPTGRTEQIIEDLMCGRTFVGTNGFTPAFQHHPGSVFDYLPKNIDVCIQEPSSVAMAMEKLRSSYELDYARKLERQEPAFGVNAHLLERSEVESFMESRFVASFHALITESSDKGLFDSPGEASDLQARETQDLADRLRRLSGTTDTTDVIGPLARYLEGLGDAGYKVEAVAHTEGQAQRLATMLEGRGLEVQTGDDLESNASVKVCVGELARGCILPAEGKAWITEEEIFGRRSRLRKGKRRAKATLQDLRELAVGDLVVHAEHGVGRYEGLHRQTVRGIEVDFILIVYKDGDKLFLPVYRLDQLQKYRSAGEGSPRVDKLGGQTFSKTKAKARKRAMEMAAKLLDLYAQREVSRRAPVDETDELYREFEAAFPFEETDDQARAIDEVMADLGGEKPMDRLICGDVGFGKTEVAMRAAFRVIMSGRQVAVLVPTTVLAQQHYLGFKKRLAQYPVRVEMASRFRTTAQNTKTLMGLKDGSVDIVVGTHRLLSKDVHFKRLGLLVIDEEHRFGVTHKERIRALRSSVDTLVMTATPIPRTLHMAFSGIRDLSLIGTAPMDRRPIKTMVCHDDPGLLRKAMERELARGGQVFFVHNRVRDIYKIAEYVERLMPGAKIAVGHGQMKEDALEQVMMDFVAGAYDILLSTTIIESGLDIPRANTMIVNRADTFGLAQLYQLRGRIGRADKQAFAYLVVPPMNALSDDARDRVEALARHTDLGSGFSLATLDLEIRGAGNLLGAEQSGEVSAVGFEMFCDLLEEASAKLRGQDVGLKPEPEVTFEDPGYLPEEYIPDVGLRLRYYKRLASARDELEVEEHVASMLDQFGQLPAEATSLVDAMNAKAICRGLEVVGLEVFEKRMSVHLGTESKVSPETVMTLVKEGQGRVRLTPDLKVLVDFRKGAAPAGREAIRFLRRLSSCEI